MDRVRMLLVYQACELFPFFAGSASRNMSMGLHHKERISFSLEVRLEGCLYPVGRAGLAPSLIPFSNSCREGMTNPVEMEPFESWWTDYQPKRSLGSCLRDNAIWEKSLLLFLLALSSSSFQNQSKLKF